MKLLKRFSILTAILIILVLLVLIVHPAALSISCEDSCEDRPDKLECLEQVKRACESKLQETSAKKQTLQSIINFLNSKISFTQSQINQTVFQIEQLKQEIQELSGRISTLDLSLDQITRQLNGRIKESYKNNRVNPIYLFLTADGFSDFVTRYKYLKTTQENNRRDIYNLEEARANYDAQKTTKEEKQQQVLDLQSQLISKKSTLDQQQKEKELLLTITKHDESRYQQALSKANAELAAIQAIIAGQGNETKVGEINQGDKIATIIPSSSTCSSGAHLHFEVVKNGVHLNPAGFLTSKSVTWDNAPDGPFSFSGSWPWPVNDPVRITQGYGMTFYASVLGYYGGLPHTGIDMINTSDLSVKAARKGTLYRGSIACGGGTLRYVHIKHSEDEHDTYYLHINYF